MLNFRIIALSKLSAILNSRMTTRVTTNHFGNNMRQSGTAVPVGLVHSSVHICLCLKLTLHPAPERHQLVEVGRVHNQILYETHQEYLFFLRSA